jgi:hypothetical protein
MAMDPEYWEFDFEEIDVSEAEAAFIDEVEGSAYGGVEEGEGEEEEIVIIDEG